MSQISIKYFSFHNLVSYRQKNSVHVTHGDSPTARRPSLCPKVSVETSGRKHIAQNHDKGEAGTQGVVLDHSGVHRREGPALLHPSSFSTQIPDGGDLGVSGSDRRGTQTKPHCSCIGTPDSGVSQPP